MTVLEKRPVSGVGVKGITRYLVVGVASVALGIGLGLGIDTISAGQSPTQAQQAVAVRGSAVGEHLDSIWQSGLVQAQALRDAALLQSRIESGLAQQQAVQAEAHVLQSRIESGLAQQQAVQAEAHVLQSRIESGLAQHDAVVSVDSAKKAMAMRGAAMADHLDELIESGEATQQALYGD